MDDSEIEIVCYAVNTVLVAATEINIYRYSMRISNKLESLRISKKTDRVHAKKKQSDCITSDKFHIFRSQLISEEQNQTGSRRVST